MTRKLLHEPEKLQRAAQHCRSLRNDEVGGETVTQFNHIAEWIEAAIEAGQDPNGLPVPRELAVRIVNARFPGMLGDTINGRPLNDDHVRGALITTLWLAAGETERLARIDDDDKARTDATSKAASKSSQQFRQDKRNARSRAAELLTSVGESESGRDIGRKEADEAWRQTLRDGAADKRRRSR